MTANNRLHAIYVLKDENNNVFYVGKTAVPNKRFNRHLTHVHNGSSYPVHNKLRKVISLKGTADGIYQIIEENIEGENIDNRETFFIKHYKDAGYKLKNLTEGGEGGKGYTSELMAKIASKNRGKKRSLDICKKISEAKKGILFSKSHKQSLKKAWKHRPPFSSEHYQKLSNIMKGKINIKRFVVLSPTGEKIITENGLSDFCRQKRLSVSNLHKTWSGNREHNKGWKIIGEA